MDWTFQSMPESEQGGKIELKEGNKDEREEAQEAEWEDGYGQYMMCSEEVVFMKPHLCTWTLCRKEAFIFKEEDSRQSDECFT